MFWSASLPADALAGEPETLAAARVDLLNETASVPVDTHWVCASMSALGGGWMLRSCGESVPNTHWHLISKDGIWAAWRVHKVHAETDTLMTTRRHWDVLDPERRRRHLTESVQVSPFALSLPDLIEEIARHGRGLAGMPNDYPYGEVHAIHMALGVEGPEAEGVRFLSALDGLPEARALAQRRGLGFDPVRTGRPMLPEPVA